MHFRKKRIPLWLQVVAALVNVNKEGISSLPVMQTAVARESKSSKTVLVTKISRHNLKCSRLVTAIVRTIKVLKLLFI